jgi:hypothetical protein
VQFVSGPHTLTQRSCAIAMRQAKLSTAARHKRDLVRWTRILAAALPILWVAQTYLRDNDRGASRQSCPALDFRGNPCSVQFAQGDRCTPALQAPRAVFPMRSADLQPGRKNSVVHLTPFVPHAGLLKAGQRISFRVLIRLMARDSMVTWGSSLASNPGVSRTTRTVVRLAIGRNFCSTFTPRTTLSTLLQQRDC